MEIIRRLAATSPDPAFTKAEAEMRAEVAKAQPGAVVRVDIYPPGLYEAGTQYVVRASTVAAPA